MGMLSKLAKGGMAKKLISEAKKPQNQAKAKQLMNKVTSKQGAKGGTRRP
ncbi:hypothetical protein HC251_06300 [Iamia sp. SCSIO 61187]|nr:hypothetical protein [Iamia sp. SCSIO 61187]QYG92089.1 hypothetical protein HC251_06300 [Iamia sp. SCSIO 61187]